jgi:hypothetical protein
LGLFEHWLQRAACTAGKGSAIKMPMMAMMTSSSTSVKAASCAEISVHLWQVDMH